MFQKFLEALKKKGKCMGDSLMEEIRMRSGTWHYLDVPDEVLSERISQVTRIVHAKLVAWFSRNDPENTLFGTFSGLGADRCQEGIPLEEVSLVIMLVKREVWKIIREQACAGDGFSLEELLEISYSVGLCFDRIIQALIAGYQNELALSAVKGRKRISYTGAGTTVEGQDLDKALCLNAPEM